MYKHTPSAPHFKNLQKYTYQQIKCYYLKTFENLIIFETDLKDVNTRGLLIEKSEKQIIFIEEKLQDYEKKDILLHEIGHLYFGDDESYAEKFRSFRLLDLDRFCGDLLDGCNLETCADHQGMELYEFIPLFENIKKEVYNYKQYRFCFEPFSIYDTIENRYIEIDIID